MSMRDLQTAAQTIRTAFGPTTTVGDCYTVSEIEAEIRDEFAGSPEDFASVALDAEAVRVFDIARRGEADFDIEAARERVRAIGRRLRDHGIETDG